MAQKHIIWSSDTGEVEAWSEFLAEEGLEFAPAAEQNAAIAEMNAEYLGDEKMNLNVKLPGTVLAITTRHLWGGDKTGWQMLTGNLNSIFEFTDGEEFWCDAWNVRAKGGNLDVTFRLVPEGVNAARLCDALYACEATPAMVRRYTRSLRPYVSAVYGWGGREISVKEVA